MNPQMKIDVEADGAVLVHVIGSGTHLSALTVI